MVGAWSSLWAIAIPIEHAFAAAANCYCSSHDSHTPTHLQFLTEVHRAGIAVGADFGDRIRQLVEAEACALSPNGLRLVWCLVFDSNGCDAKLELLDKLIMSMFTVPSTW